MFEVPEEDPGELSQGENSTIEESYRKTAELGKKFIRVDIPSLQTGD